MTVAVRGTSRSSAISPKKSPGPSRVCSAPSIATAAVPSAITKKRSPASPCSNTVAAGSDVQLGGDASEPLDRGRRERREDRDRAQQLERLDGDARAGVDRRDLPPGQERQRGEDDADDDERRARARAAR